MLRNQIGSEGLTAVIEHLPTQYTKRALSSKSERAAYVDALLKSKQRPFIWEYFRPGTIEIPRGEETYYDEVSSNFSRMTGYLLSCILETYRPVPVDSRSPRLLSILLVIRHPIALSVSAECTGDWKVVSLAGRLCALFVGSACFTKQGCLIP